MEGTEGNDEDLIFINEGNKKLSCFKPTFQIRKDLMEKAIKHVETANLHKKKANDKKAAIICDGNDTLDFKDSCIHNRKTKLKLKNCSSVSSKDNLKTGLDSNTSKNIVQFVSQNEVPATSKTFIKDNNVETLCAAKKLCFICSSSFDILEFESHLQSCLKLKFSKTSDVAGTSNYQICEKSIAPLQEPHTNKCMEKVENCQENYLHTESFGISSKTVLNCPMCGKKFQTAASRRSHLKKCSASNKMSAEMVKNMLRQQDEEYQSKLQAGILSDEIVLKQKQCSKAKPSLSKDDDLQLAMALSLSIVEENDSHGIYAEESLNANLGNCKQTKDQKGSNGRKKNEKKAKQLEPTPLLMSLSKDQAYERILQRVDKYIFSKHCVDDKQAQFFKSHSKMMSDLTVSEEIDPKLWFLTSLEIGETNQHPLQFYVMKLMPPLKVSNVETGSKIQRLSFIPGRRKSLEGPLQQEQKSSDDKGTSLSQTAEILANLVMENEMSDSHQEVIVEENIHINQKKSLPSSEDISVPEFFPETTKEDNECFNSSLKDSYLALVNTSSFSDVVVLAEGDTQIFAHKVVLHARCSKLLNMVSSRDGTSIIDLSVYSKDSVLSTLKFVYADVISCSKYTASNIVELSAMLGLEKLGAAAMSHCVSTQIRENLVDRENVQECDSEEEENRLNNEDEYNRHNEDDYSRHTMQRKVHHNPIIVDSDVGHTNDIPMEINHDTGEVNEDNVAIELDSTSSESSPKEITSDNQNDYGDGNKIVEVLESYYDHELLNILTPDIASTETVLKESEMSITSQDKTETVPKKSEMLSITPLDKTETDPKISEMSITSLDKTETVPKKSEMLSITSLDKTETVPKKSEMLSITSLDKTETVPSILQSASYDKAKNSRTKLGPSVDKSMQRNVSNSVTDEAKNSENLSCHSVVNTECSNILSNSLSPEPMIMSNNAKNYCGTMQLVQRMPFSHGVEDRLKTSLLYTEENEDVSILSDSLSQEIIFTKVDKGSDGLDSVEVESHNNSNKSALPMTETSNVQSEVKSTDTNPRVGLAKKRKRKKITSKHFKDIVKKVVSKLHNDDQQNSSEVLSTDDVESIAIKMEQDFFSINNFSAANDSVYFPYILDQVELDTEEIMITFADIKVPLEKQRGKRKIKAKNLKELGVTSKSHSSLPNNNDSPNKMNNKQKRDMHLTSHMVSNQSNKDVMNAKEDLSINKNLNSISQETYANLGKHFVKCQTSSESQVEKPLFDTRDGLSTFCSEMVESSHLSVPFSNDQVATNALISDDELFSDTDQDLSASINKTNVRTPSDTHSPLPSLNSHNSNVSTKLKESEYISTLLSTEGSSGTDSYSSNNTFKTNEVFVKEKIHSDVVISHIAPCFTNQEPCKVAPSTEHKKTNDFLSLSIGLLPEKCQLGTTTKNNEKSHSVERNIKQTILFSESPKASASKKTLIDNETITPPTSIQPESKSCPEPPKVITSLKPSIYLVTDVDTNDTQIGKASSLISIPSKSVQKAINSSDMQLTDKYFSTPNINSTGNLNSFSNLNISDISTSPLISKSKSPIKTKRGLAKKNSPILLSSAALHKSHESFLTSPLVKDSLTSPARESELFPINTSQGASSLATKAYLSQTIPVESDKDDLLLTNELKKKRKVSSGKHCLSQSDVKYFKSETKVNFVLSPELVHTMAENLAKVTQKIQLDDSIKCKADNNRKKLNEKFDNEKSVATVDKLASSNNIQLTVPLVATEKTNNPYQQGSSREIDMSPLPLHQRLGLLNPLSKSCEHIESALNKTSTVIDLTTLDAQEKNQDSDFVFDDTLNVSELEEIALASPNKLPNQDIFTTNTEFVQAKTPANQKIKQLVKEKGWKEPSPFTPMPQYDEMATPDLKKAASKIGVRPAVGKKRLKELLKHVYSATHQYETDSDYEGTPVKYQRNNWTTKTSMPNNHKLAQTFKKKKGKTQYTSVKTKNVGIDPSDLDKNVTSMNSLECFQSSVQKDEDTDELLTASQDSSYSDGPDLPEESILKGWPEEEVPLDYD
ncbi:structure-specific endonuclease subunit SLX4, partial [Biomphalaria pfeifferi]